VPIRTFEENDAMVIKVNANGEVSNAISILGVPKRGVSSK
jgi:hypothetical protein